MSVKHRVLVTIKEAFQARVSKGSLERISAGVLQQEVESSVELHVLITDDATIRELNRRYAGDDHATDVLSFSLREGEEFVAPDETVRLGEVIISYPTAEHQAAELGHSVEDEIAHLLTHGVLHLLGYDHLNPTQERRMRARETELLGRDAH